MTSPATADDLLVQLAVTADLITEDQVAAAQVRLESRCDASAGGIYDELVDHGELDPSRAARLLAEHLGMPAVGLSQVEVPGNVLELVPRALAAHYHLFPFARQGNVLRVAVADPLEADGIDALPHLLNLEVAPAFAPADEINGAIERFYGRERSDWDESPDAHVSGAAAASVPAGATSDADAPIVKLVHAIIAEAVKQRASDIHLEPWERRFRVRYRIDGALVPADPPPKRLQPAIISRVKIMAGMSIAEKRLPQDGRIQIEIEGRPLDLRVSSLPTAHGEGIVMRILDQANLKLGLAELGFMADDRETFDRLIAQPDGILLVTGPTGSGKTTTLYSCLHAINQPDRKIITVEDPVEYQLSGINQVPVRSEVGMTFAAALRAMLRQAPNVVMVGEVRDFETAEIAVHASLTGHLVFSTLHTNDAPSAVTRLIDLGVKPFLVATSLRGIMAQRLVRKICPECAEAYVPTVPELEQLNLTPAMAAQATFRRGRGCPACHGTGYRGRTGIFEILIVDDDLRQLIHAGASAAKLREKARWAGMRTLREDGARKVIAGLTTIEEVVSITIGDTR